MSEKTPSTEVTDYLQSLRRDQPSSPEGAAPAFVQPLPVAAAAASAPTAAPVASESTEPALSTPVALASPQRRPLAYFTTPAQVTTKKQSVYLSVELHRALTTVVNLPDVEVSLTDLLANIVQAWREDHRAEVRKRYRDGEKSI